MERGDDYKFYSHVNYSVTKIKVGLLAYSTCFTVT